MKKFDARYSKLLLILIGVLVALVIGFQSNAVGFDSEVEINTALLNHVENIAPILKRSGELHVKLLSLLR